MRKVSCPASPRIGCASHSAHRVRARVLPGLLAAIAVFTLPCALSAALPLENAATPKRATGCGEPGISLSPEAGGITQISIASPCRTGELVSITYADATLVERLDK